MTTKTLQPDSIQARRAAYADRLNKLRAGVLGANDGIVSVAATVIGVAAATTNVNAIIITAIAAVSAGALSMAVGEYVSVSSQRDSERAMLEWEKRELEKDPEGQLRQLVDMHMEHGLSHRLAVAVAREQTEKDPLSAHAVIEHGIHPGQLVNPWSAAFASLFAFLVGGLVPALSATLLPEPARIPGTFVMVVVALAGTGYFSARLGKAPLGPAMARVMIGGALAMTITYGIGSLVGLSV